MTSSAAQRMASSAAQRMASSAAHSAAHDTQELQWLNDEKHAKAVKVAHQTVSKLKSLAATMFEIIAVTAVKTFYD